MTNKEKYLKIQEIFDDIYSDADCSLDYENPFHLLVAVQLAAQCTDARVNMVTPHLFEILPDVKAFAEAETKVIEELIKSTGFYHNKAKNLKACAQKLISDFGGEVPDNMEDLLSLPGVGRKTANLIMGDVFGKGGVVVDTHCKRITKKIGFTKHDDPTKVEFDLVKIIPKENQSRFCHQIVWHGREICIARRPKCDICPIKEYCRSFK